MKRPRSSHGLVPGGTAIVNADLPVSPILLRRRTRRGRAARQLRRQPRRGLAADRRRLIRDDTTVVRATATGSAFLFKVATPGRHFALNALGALAAATALGADPVISAHDLGRWTPPAGRGTRERIQLDIVEETFFDLIDDAFNANPASHGRQPRCADRRAAHRRHRPGRQRPPHRHSGRHAGAGPDRAGTCTPPSPAIPALPPSPSSIASARG